MAVYKKYISIDLSLLKVDFYCFTKENETEN